MGLQKDIEKSAEEYAQVLKKVSPRVYAQDRLVTTYAVREALRRTSMLADIAPEAVAGGDDVLEALCNMCVPPLSREKLAALSRVPARRILAIQRGERPARASSELRLAESDLPAICRVLSELVDPDFAPWVKEGRPCEPGEEDRLVAVAADRMSGARARNATAEAIDEHYADRLCLWLEGRGYASRRIEDAPAPGTYLKAARSDEIDVSLKGGGEALLRVSCFSDPANAIRSRARMEKAAKERQGERAFVHVLAGCIEAPLVSYLEKKDVPYAWAHRPRSLERYGL